MPHRQEKTESIAKASKDIENEELAKLKAVFPQFVADGEIDFDGLKAYFKDEDLLADDEKYGLGWAGKGNARKLTKTKATGTLTPAKDESKDWKDTDNLFLEGDNLEILKLLQAHYRKKVKMIYIDPPYNTGKDFIYKDNYKQDKSDYYERTGQKDEDGVLLTSNPESSGRFHSDWLTMMYPRLFLAKNLLKEDGVIFVSIDDNEVHNLRHVMDRVFGETNFIGQLVHQRAKGGGQAKHLVKGHDYILVYAKKLSDNIALKREKVIQSEVIEKNGVQYIKDDDVVRKTFGKYDKSMDRRCFYEELEEYKGKEKKKEIDEKIKNEELFLEEKEDGKHVIYSLTPVDEAYSKLYSIVRFLSEKGKDELESLDIPVFDYPKPKNLIKFLIESVSFNSSNDDLILDFFAGSGTTAEAVMDLNAKDGGIRKSICVQIPEELDEGNAKTQKQKKSIKSAIKLLEDLNKPTNIAEIAKERIRRAGERVKEEQAEELENRDDPLDVGFKAFKLEESNYRQWQNITDEDGEEDLKEQMELFAEKPLVDNYEELSVVYEVTLKEGLSLNSTVEKSDGLLDPWVVTDQERKLLITFADEVSKEQVEHLDLSDEDTFVCFDNALDDTTKVNLMRNFNIKVI